MNPQRPYPPVQNGNQDRPGLLTRADKLAYDLLSNPPRARLDVTAAKAITSGALNALAFDSATYNSAGASGGAVPWTAGANTRFIVPAGGAGLYEFLVEVDWAGSAAGTTRAAYIRVNGTVYIGGGFMLPTAAGPVTTAVGAYPLVAGDYVEIVPYQDAGVAVNVTAAHAHFRRASV